MIYFLAVLGYLLVAWVTTLGLLYWDFREWKRRHQFMVDRMSFDEQWAEYKRSTLRFYCAPWGVFWPVTWLVVVALGAFFAAEWIVKRITQSVHSVSDGWNVNKAVIRRIVS